MEGTIGEIRLFAGNFAPKNWNFCDGSILSITQNAALFSILGVTYGGNGQTTFGLPDLRSRVAIGAGQGPGLTQYALGEQTGVENVTITTANMPAHTHAMMATSDSPGTNVAAGASLASNTRSTSPTMPNIYENGAANQVPMASQTGPAGNNMPVSLIQPTLALEYIVCLYGTFPSRN